MNGEIVYAFLIVIGIWAVIICVVCVAIDLYHKRKDRRQSCKR
jgi:hypothetical protein